MKSQETLSKPRTKVELTPAQKSKAKNPLRRSSVSNELFQQYKNNYKELPKYLSFRALDFLPPGIKDMFYVYDPEVIAALHGSKSIERAFFQTLLKSLGRLTSQRATDTVQRELRQITQKELTIKVTEQRLPQLAATAQSHIEHWAKIIAANPDISFPVAEINNEILMDMAAEMFGVPIDAQLKEALNWLFLEGLEAAVLPRTIRKAGAILAPKLKNKIQLIENMNKANDAINHLSNLVDNAFYEYVISSNSNKKSNSSEDDESKGGLVFTYIEYFLNKEFENSTVDQTLAAVLEKWAFTFKFGTEEEKLAILQDPIVSRALRNTVDQLMGSFSAAYETTGTASAWTDIIAAVQPEIFAKVCEEATRIPDISKLRFVDMLRFMPNTYAFIAEILRLYPPLGLQFREALEDIQVKIDGEMVTFPKGSIIHIDHYSSAEFTGTEISLDKHLQQLNEHSAAHTSTSSTGETNADKHPTLMRRQDKELQARAGAHQAFEHGGIHNCVGKYDAVIKLMVILWAKARSFSGFEVVAPEEVDYLIPNLGATNTPQLIVEIRPILNTSPKKGD